MASSLHLQWHPLLPTKTRKALFIRSPDKHFIAIHHVASTRVFRRSDFDGFAKRVASGKALRDAWWRANDGFELLVFETKKTTERINRRYAVSRRLSAVAQAATDKLLNLIASLRLRSDGPLLIGAIANNLVIKGECPSCRKQFIGYKSQTIQCASCGNIVWQTQGGSSKRGRRGTTSSSRSQPDNIDVEFEEK